MRFLLSIPVAFALVVLVLAPPVQAACPADTTLQVYSGISGTPCPCFIQNEEAGTVFTAPAEHYPLEIIKVGIVWGSAFGGNPQQIEDAIRIYNAGLPNPGAYIFELLGPQLTDGVINEFDLEPILGEIMIPSGDFSVTLRFLNQNSGDQFAPSVMYESGCQIGKNLVYAIPGGWSDACLLGVPGDWMFYVVYKPCQSSQTGIGDDPIFMASQPLMLLPASPNPFRGATDLQFVLGEAATASIQVYDTAGRLVATVAEKFYEAGTHQERWTPDADLKAGVYFVKLRAGEHESSSKVVLAR